MTRTAKALEQHKRLAALRAAEDPDKVAKALRVVRAAIDTNRLTVAEVVEAVAVREPSCPHQLAAPAPGSSPGAGANPPDGAA